MPRTYGSTMLEPTKNSLRWKIRRLEKENEKALARINELAIENADLAEKLDKAYHLIGRQRLEAALAKDRLIKISS